MIAYSVPTRPMAERWVKCEWHKAFHIRCENLTGERLEFKMYVDGVQVTGREVKARRVSLLEDVRTGAVKVGRELRKPLVFTQPSYVAAEGEEGGREGPMEGIEKLGRVMLKVYKLKKVRPRLVNRFIVKAEEMEGKVEATEKEGAKKGKSYASLGVIHLQGETREGGNY